MDFKNVSYYVEFLEFIIGLFLLIVIYQLLVKALKFILKGIAHAARIIFKAMYILLAIVISVSGAGYAIYTGLLFLNHEPINILWTLAGLFAAIFGMIGLVNFFKNGFEFSSEPPSINSYPTPRSELISYDWDNDDRSEREAAQKQYWKDKEQERLDEDRYKAEAAERRKEYDEQKEQERANYEADQEKWAEFDRKRAEADEYNRQERAKWTQQDE